MIRTPHRPWPQRFAALLLAVLFSLSGAREGIAGYVCIRHSDHGDHAAAAHTGAAHAEHAQAAHDHAGTQQAGAADDGVETSDAPAPCDCIGDCQAGQTSARAEGESVAEVTYSAPLVALRSTEVTRLPGTPKFLLPFSNGPPVLG